MIIGSLLEVMVITEDYSKSAMNSKINKIKAKYKSAKVLVLDANTKENYFKKLRQVLTPEQIEHIKDKIMPPEIRELSSNDIRYVKWMKGNMFKENGEGAYDRYSGFILLLRNSDVGKECIGSDCSINMSHPLIAHETRHKQQYDILKILSKSKYNKKHKPYSYYDNKYKEHLSYLNKHDSNNEYVVDPLEYDADMAAARKLGLTKEHSSIKRSMKTALKLTKKPMRIDPVKRMRANRVVDGKSFTYLSKDEILTIDSMIKSAPKEYMGIVEDRIKEAYGINLKEAKARIKDYYEKNMK